MSYSYKYPGNPVPRLFLTKRHNYVRKLIHSTRILDIGSSHYKILSKAISIDTNSEVKPDILGSCLKLPFKPESFRYVTLLEVIEHFTDFEQDQVLKEIYRVLEKKGKLIVSTPNLWPNKKIHDLLWFISHSIYARKDLGSHVKELSHRELKNKLRENSFSVKSAKAFSLFNYVVECEKC